MRAGRVRANHASSRCRRASNGSGAQILRRLEQHVVEPHGGRIIAQHLRADGLRLSRCCRSANGATSPSRITSSSPSSTPWNCIASTISGKAPEMSSAPRE